MVYRNINFIINDLVFLPLLLRLRVGTGQLQHLLSQLHQLPGAIHLRG